MPNTTVPAAATGLPDLPRPPQRFRMVDDFTGQAGELTAALLACEKARQRLAIALQQRNVKNG